MGNAFLSNNILGDPFGQKAGKEEAKLTSEQKRSLQQSREISQALFQQATAPSLALLFGAPGSEGEGGIFPEFLRTGELPPALSLEPNFSSVRDATEQQFQVARENILSRVPSRGGQLNDQLANLEAERARTLASQNLEQQLLEGPIRERFFTQGFNTAFGFPSVSIAGLLGSAQGYSAAANRYAGLQQGRQEETLGLLGTAAGMMAK